MPSVRGISRTGYAPTLPAPIFAPQGRGPRLPEGASEEGAVDGAAEPLRPVVGELFTSGGYAHGLEVSRAGTDEVGPSPADVPCDLLELSRLA